MDLQNSVLIIQKEGLERRRTQSLCHNRTGDREWRKGIAYSPEMRVTRDESHHSWREVEMVMGMEGAVRRGPHLADTMWNKVELT